MWNLLQSHHAVCQEPDGTVRAEGARPAALLPGSFNPLHHGHLALAAVASARLGAPVAFELSLVNVDKAELSSEEVARRLAQFMGRAPIWVTRAATFVTKAELFPGVVFVLGHDTATRLVDPKYYRNDVGLRNESLRGVAARGCRVVVGGRMDASGAFRTWTGEGLPDDLSALFVPLPESDFRVDVSSTSLRGGM